MAKKAKKKPPKTRKRPRPKAPATVAPAGIHLVRPPVHLPSQAPAPTHRRLRGYAFDPGMATQLETALVSEVVFKVPWEPLDRGPIGEYVEVVDYDPPSRCYYEPVDLGDSHILAQDGLAPSEGNPQFHQQMVYAAAMTTIDRFERTLGRRAVWADRYKRTETIPDAEQYVQRLRLYPHALRVANAYYSREKRAILFGYFPGTEDRTTAQFPGGMTFTCLSHDIIAHEMTHALLDGFHEYFMEATNPDVLAFHEAFADIVALFQHFTFPEVLAHQIAKTRGDLGNENLLVQLATQFGHARGSYGALRDAIGGWDPEQKKWVRYRPDATALDETLEVHARGAILVAAVFDAFLSIYAERTRDLLRLSSGGTGILREGALHPDLINRLSREAVKAAEHVLTMCIRALDYCPPVDLTFGEYLRALITADMDLIPDDQHRYRVAFIEAFRRRGIYPRTLRTLSEDSLRWSRPEEDPAYAPGEMATMLANFIAGIDLRAHVDKLRYLRDRREIWTMTRGIRADLHDAIRSQVAKAEILQNLTGLALTYTPPGVKVHRGGEPVFAVQALREARRAKEDGRSLNQVFITLLQKETLDYKGAAHTMRCGSTLVIDLDEARVVYVIRKGLHDRERLERTVAYRDTAARDRSLAETYFGPNAEMFAALHGLGV